MGLFGRRKIKNEEKTFTIQEINEYFNNSDILSAVGKSSLTAATYYACMMIRCNALAKIPFKVYKQDGDGSQTVPHYLNELLKSRPNPYMSAHDFKWATEFQKLEYGDAFWVYDFYNGEIKALYMLDSTRVEIMIDDVGLLDKPNSVYYLYNDSRKGKLFYPEDRIVHFKHYSTNGIKGNSIKKYLVDVIQQEKYAQQVVKVYVNNRLLAGVQRFDTFFHIVSVTHAQAPRLVKHYLSRLRSYYLIAGKRDYTRYGSGYPVNVRNFFALVAFEDIVNCQTAENISSA